MTTSPEIKLKELLEEFGVAMLVTHNSAGDFRARPMALADVEADGSVWFATDRNAEKVNELTGDNRAAVTMQSSTKFVSLTGTASLIDDREKVRKLWKMAWSVWFPGGKDDPNILLLKVVGKEGEYWDNSGINGLKYLIAAGKALITGKRAELDDDPKIHSKVEL